MLPLLFSQHLGLTLVIFNKKEKTVTNTHARPI